MHIESFIIHFYIFSQICSIVVGVIEEVAIGVDESDVVGSVIEVVGGAIEFGDCVDVEIILFCVDVEDTLFDTLFDTLYCQGTPLWRGIRDI